MMGVVDPPACFQGEGIVKAVRRLLRCPQREEKRRRQRRQRHETDRTPEADRISAHEDARDSTGVERIPGDTFRMERNRSARSGSTGRTSRLQARAASGEGMRSASARAA